MKTFVIPSTKRAVAPTASENLSAGYPIGQHWLDTETGKEYYHSSDGVWEDLATVDAVNLGLATKVDKIAGKSLILDTEIARLATVTNQTKQTLGIENVDNTSDAAKPISTATQTALNGKVNTADIEQVRSRSTNKVASSKLLDDELTALENAVDAVTVDTLGNTEDIRLLENVINSANINQETTATATGVDTVVLPKTAANTGMSVQLFGQSAQNLVVNGDFRNGLTGWINYSGGQSVIESGYVKYTPTLVYGAISNGLKQLSVGNKWYVRTIIKSSLPVNVSVGFAKLGVGTIMVTGNIGTSDTTISGILTIANADINEFIVGRPTVVQDIYIKKAYAINLTAIFGAGNEPTKEQCDLLFANYFEGSKNVLGTGRIRSVNSAGLVPSYLYFNGGQLRSNGLIKDEIRKGTNGYELVKRVGVGTFGAELMQNPLNFTSGWTAIGGATIVDADTVSSASGNSFIFRGNVLSLKKYVRLKLSGTTTARLSINDGVNSFISNVAAGSFNIDYCVYTSNRNTLYIQLKDIGEATFTEFSIKEVNTSDGTATGTTGTVIGSSIHYTLATPTITPIAHAGLLNSNSNGTAYFEPIIADAGVYSTNLAIQLTDYPIASFESIRKYANGTYTELNTATAVIAGDGLSFTHPDLVSGDLVMFTYAYSKESIGRSMTLTYYDNRYVKVDTANGKTYRIDFVVTNGVVVPTATEV